MKILMTIMVFHPVVGGTEISARELARSLARRGHGVEILTLRMRGLPAREVMDGIVVRRVLRGFGRGPLFILSYMVSLGGALVGRRGRFDILHTHYAYLDAIVCALLRPALGARAVVVRLGGGAPAGDLSRLRRLRVAWWALPLIKRLDRFVVMSRSMRQELIEAGFAPARITLIPNGVDLEAFAPPGQAERSAAPEQQAPTVVSVARLSPEKGIDVLLLAWHAALPRLPGARLELIGDGPQRQELARLARALGLDGSVAFRGEVADVRPWLRAGAVFVLPSRSEGLPNALLQAMAMGLPCVATRVGGIPEVIEDGVNGRLVDPGQPEALARVLAEILQDGEQAGRLGAAARRCVEERFTLEQMVDRYLECYRDARSVG